VEHGLYMVVASDLGAQGVWERVGVGGQDVCMGSAAGVLTQQWMDAEQRQQPVPAAGSCAAALDRQQ
jgi:hypothetical protein